MTRTLLLLALILAAFISPLFGQSISDAKISFYNGQYEATLTQLQPKIGASTATIDELIMAAQCKFQLFNYTDASSLFELALATDSLSTTALDGLAKTSESLGYYHKAVGCYRKLLELKSDNTRTLMNLAQVLMKMQQSKEAEQILLSLYDSDTANVYYLKQLGALYYKQENYRKATARFTKVRDYQPNDIENLFFLAASLQKVDLENEALSNLNAILAIDSMFYPALAKKAGILMNQKNYEQAELFYVKASKANGSCTLDQYKSCGVCKYFNGKHEEAIQMLSPLLLIDGSDPFTYFYIGLSYIKIAKNDSAQIFLEQAAQLSIPTYAADVYHHLGRVYSLNRDPENALKAYNKVIEFDSTNNLIYYDIAVLYEENKMNKAVALHYYKEFLRNMGDNSNSGEVKYALTRVTRIKEELFMEGKE